jgi:RNA polymerase-binding transcription factor DksA
MNTKYPEKVLKEVKKFLAEEKALISKRLGQMDDSDPYKDPDHANDNADIGVDVREEIAHQQTEANRSQLQKRLAEIEEVKKRIDQGGYGFCKICSKMIDTDRLSSNPLATMCIDCAKKQEKKG